MVSDHQEEIDAMYEEMAVKQQNDVARREEDNEIEKRDKLPTSKN